MTRDQVVQELTGMYRAIVLDLKADPMVPNSDIDVVASVLTLAAVVMVKP